MWAKLKTVKNLLRLGALEPDFVVKMRVSLTFVDRKLLFDFCMDNDNY